ncbi:MAG: DNA topoisomerase III [Candidatus Choladocola sp.]|nr:DNA topoisomerase III [Candidatus Choladocola sp.]
MKTLVLAEKPSVGRDIARVLHCQQKADGYIEGKEYVVTWGLGHLVELKTPEGYDSKYKEWKAEDLPIMPEKLETEVIAQTRKQYRTVYGLLQRKEIQDVVIATDAGREGELVARWILQKAGCRKRCRRLWISSVTDKAIREGFANLKDARAYDNLFAAAVSRAEADWLVGINATRALTCKYNAQLSCGRVQTPTLAMIAAREEEIRRFQPETYYTVKAEVQGITFQWKDSASGSMRTFSKERAEQIRSSLTGKAVTVTKAEKKKKKTYASQLYDLTELQRECNCRFGYSAKETLNIMQRLYENHKVLTYPRTDSRYLTGDIVPTLRERIDSCGIGPYRVIAAKVKNRTFSGSLPFVNDGKVSDHHAIIPTEQVPELSHMTVDERRVYDLVVRRFLAVLYPAFEYEETVLTAECAGNLFAAKGKTVLVPGWKEAYGDLEADTGEEEEDDCREQILPPLQQGAKLPVKSVRLKEGKTKPPARFREATLLSAMENPVRYMGTSDKTRAKTLTETGGLGTVATRADIIDKLFGSFLMEKKGQDIYLTAKGRQLLQLVPEDLRRPELTADWEMKLAQIADGTMRRDRFMKEIRSYTEELLREIRTQEGTYRHENMTNKKCPECGKRLLAVNGKNAKLLVCQDRNCGYRETVSRTSNARCPVCHKKMELSGNGENATFFCSCGYRERLEKFKERRQKEGAGVTKRDVAAYMKKQKKDAAEPVNNGLAAALAGIKLDQKD